MIKYIIRQEVIKIVNESIFTNTSGDKFWGDLAAGILPIAKDSGKILLSYRSKYVNEPNTWGIWGGAVDKIEDSVLNTARKEFKEETKFSGTIILIPSFIFKSPNNTFEYHNFIGILDSEFIPKLDWETEKFKWVTFDEMLLLPNKHFGLKSLINNDLNTIKHYSEVDN